MSITSNEGNDEQALLNLIGDIKKSKAAPKQEEKEVKKEKKKKVAFSPADDQIELNDLTK